jgi:hypothetical protein
MLNGAQSDGPVQIGQAPSEEWPMEWWLEKTQELAHDYCPTCHPELDPTEDHLLTVRYCYTNNSLDDTGSEDEHSRRPQIFLVDPGF